VVAVDEAGEAKLDEGDTREGTGGVAGGGVARGEEGRVIVRLGEKWWGVNENGASVKTKQERERGSKSWSSGREVGGTRIHQCKLSLGWAPHTTALGTGSEWPPLAPRARVQPCSTTHQSPLLPISTPPTPFSAHPPSKQQVQWLQRKRHVPTTQLCSGTGLCSVYPRGRAR